MNLQHYRASDMATSGCFTEITTLDEFIKANQKFSTWAEARNLNQEAASQAKGDALEVLGEFLFRRNGLDGRLGCIRDYYNAPEGQQGVDGYGRNDKNQNVAIQYKFISNGYDVVSANSLQSFLGAALGQFNVDFLNNRVLIVVTTGRGVCPTYKAQFGPRNNVLFVINRDALQYICNNPTFWLDFRASLSASIRVNRRIILNLFQHQMDAKKQIVEFLRSLTIRRGQVLIPTGGGKTLLEAESSWESFRRGGKIVLLCSPRLRLGKQLLKDFYFNKPADIDLEIIPVASGQITLDCDCIIEDEVPARFYPTTNVKSIVERLNLAIAANKKVLIVSTYHSMDCAGAALLSMGLTVDLGIADEAHNVVSGDFRAFLHDNIVPIKKRLFCTATQKTSWVENGRGMNNTEQFGEVIYRITPIELIKRGIIVSPKLHILDFDYIDYAGDFANDLKEQTKINLAMTIVGMRGHLKRVGNDGRLIVFCSSAKEAATFANSATKENQVLRRYLDPSIKMFALTSEHGLFHSDRPDDLAPSKDGILADFSSAQKGILFHYNIVSEGIDIPSLTAVMLLRGVDRIMVIQAVGRTLRPDNADRKALQDQRIRPWNDEDSSSSWTEGWAKPYGWIIIPRMLGVNDDDASSLIYILKNLTDYGFDFSSQMIAHEKVVTSSNPPEAYDIRDDLEVVAGGDDIFVTSIRTMVQQIREEELELMIRPRAFNPTDIEGIAEEPDDVEPVVTKKRRRSR